MTIADELHQTAWLIRRNLDDGDRRMAIENVNALISLIETGAVPNDLPSARQLWREIEADLSEPRGTGGVPLVRKVGAHLT